MSCQDNQAINNPSSPISADDLALLEACRKDPSILLGQADHCWHNIHGKRQSVGWLTVRDAKERLDDRYPFDI